MAASTLNSTSPALNGVPGPLAAAIRNASAQYGVPPDLLAGIWRVESASTYPNPAVNSLGYGGLFGTKNWNASTQEQANTAAGILAGLLKSNGGDVAKSLSEYSGGGYTSVPGQTTGPTIGTSGLHGGSFGQVAQSPQAQGSPYGGIPGGGAVKDVVGGISSVTDALKFLTSWRFAEVVGGFVLLLVGLVLLGRQFGVSVPVPGPAGKAAGAVSGPGPAGRAAGAVSGQGGRAAGAVSGQG